MKWFRYFLLAFISCIIIFFIILYSQQINLISKNIFILSESKEIINSAKIKIDDLFESGEVIESDKISSVLDTILNKIDNAPLVIQNEDHVKVLLLMLSAQDIMKNRDILISEIRDLESDIFNSNHDNFSNFMIARNKRDSLFILLIFLYILFFYVEYLKIKSINIRISKYINKLTFRKYNFTIEASDTPYLNNILKDIDKLKTNMATIDMSTQETLKGFNIHEVLGSFYKSNTFKNYIHFDKINFITIKDDYFVNQDSFPASKDEAMKKGMKVKKSEFLPLESLIKNKEIKIINNIKKFYLSFPKTDALKFIIQDGIESILIAPLYNTNDRTVGILFFNAKERNAYQASDKYKMQSLISIFSSVFEKNMLIEDLVTNSALTFVKLVEGKDPETSYHIDRVSHYSKIIAKKLGEKDKYKTLINYSFIETLYKYAPLHDIGKIGIPDKILLKPGKLTDDEFEIMKEHTKIGAKVLNYYQNNLKKYSLPIFNTAIEIAIAHHEKWDGSGYPLGKKGTEIPLSARIVAVADVFDALSSKRSYKEAFPFEKSLEIIKESCGTHFDPEVTQAFFDSLEDIRAVYDRLKEV